MSVASNGMAGLPGCVGLAAWNSAWEAMGAAAAPQAIYQKVVQHYAQSHRAYHTLQHLDECLTLRRLLGAPCAQPAEIDLALWFHDAIYEPLRRDNEHRSAQWLDEVARDSGVDVERRQRLRRLVMVTCHDGAPSSADEAVLVDTDLAILGASAERFAQYEQQIRREYRHVPEFLYQPKRRKVLQGFQSRERIFATASYFEAFENQARLNLGRALGRLA